MTSHNVTKSFPHGLTNTYKAPLSGCFTQSAVETALGNLPDNLAELRKVWQSIGSVRNSGLVSVHDGGPLDDAVRNGVWDASLQQRMPTVGGLPGSRGILQNWPHHNSDNYYANFYDVAPNSGLANSVAHTAIDDIVATTQVTTDFSDRGTTETDDNGTIGFDSNGMGNFGRLGLGFGDLAGNFGSNNSNKFQNKSIFQQTQFETPSVNPRSNGQVKGGARVGDDKGITPEKGIHPPPSIIP